MTDPRVLCTDSRLPNSFEVIKKLVSRGVSVTVADTYPALADLYADIGVKVEVVPSPRYSQHEFVRSVEAVVTASDIDIVVPLFESGFALTAGGAGVALGRLPPFCPNFETLSALHHKGTFATLCDTLELPVAATTTLPGTKIAPALAGRPTVLAKPAYSRAGEHVLTSAEAAQRLGSEPWVIQELIPGVDLSSFSVVSDGRIVAHVAYMDTSEEVPAGDEQMRTVDPCATYLFAQRLADATRYHGFLGLDFIQRNGGEIIALECNPRLTRGVRFLTDQAILAGIVGSELPTLLTPEGVDIQVDRSSTQGLTTGWRDVSDIVWNGAGAA